MYDLIDEYLEYLHEFGMPSAGLMPARQPAGYKHVPGPIGKTPEEKEEEEEEVKKLKIKKEYTSYNPHGSGYGMMLQRWSYTKADPMARGGINTTSAYPSQKTVKKDVTVTFKTRKKKKKGEEK